MGGIHPGRCLSKIHEFVRNIKNRDETEEITRSRGIYDANSTRRSCVLRMHKSKEDFGELRSTMTRTLQEEEVAVYN